MSLYNDWGGNGLLDPYNDGQQWDPSNNGQQWDPYNNGQQMDPYFNGGQMQTGGSSPYGGMSGGAGAKGNSAVVEVLKAGFSVSAYTLGALSLITAITIAGTTCRIPYNKWNGVVWCSTAFFLAAVSYQLKNYLSRGMNIVDALPQSFSSAQRSSMMGVPQKPAAQKGWENFTLLWILGFAVVVWGGVILLEWGVLRPIQQHECGSRYGVPISALMRLRVAIYYMLGVLTAVPVIWCVYERSQWDKEFQAAMSGHNRAQMNAVSARPQAPPGMEEIPGSPGHYRFTAAQHHGVAAQYDGVAAQHHGVAPQVAPQVTPAAPEGAEAKAKSLPPTQGGFNKEGRTAAWEAAYGVATMAGWSSPVNASFEQVYGGTEGEQWDNEDFDADAMY